MNYILFITILAWAGLVWMSFQLLRSIITCYHYEFTPVGRLEKTLMAARGRKIIGYYFPSRIISIVVCVAILVSLP